MIDDRVWIIQKLIFSFAFFFRKCFFICSALVFRGIMFCATAGKHA